MQFILYPIAIYILLLLSIRYIVPVLQLYKVELQYPKFTIQNYDLVPLYIQDLLKTPIQELEKLGFKFCCYLLVEPISKLHPLESWEVLLYHLESQTYAKVALQYPADVYELFDIEFYNFFEDKTLLITMNGKAYRMVGELPNRIVQDVYTPYWSVQWQFHQDKLKELRQSKIVCNLKFQEFIKALEKEHCNYLDGLSRKGKIVKFDSARTFHATIATALQVTYKINTEGNKLKKAFEQRKLQAQADTNTTAEIPIELEVESFYRLEKSLQLVFSKKLRNLLLIASFCVYAAVTYSRILNVQDLLLLLGVLVFHEAGHVIAMKLCGYQDTSMLFIPFMGAVATARQKDDATLVQKFWVSMAGPLPGLLLGIVLSISNQSNAYPDWVNTLTWMLIGLNLFNLLPVYPLDGGQIAELLIFSRFTYAKVIFQVIGALLLGLFALANPGILVLTIAVLASIPLTLRTASFNKQLRKHFRNNPPANREAMLRSIFVQMKQLGHDNLPFHQKYTLAKQFIERRQEWNSNSSTKLLLIVLYFGSLFGGVIGTLQAVIPAKRKFCTDLL